MREVKHIKVQPEIIKEKLLAWAKNQREVVFLDSNNYPQTHGCYDAILAVEAFTSLQTDYHNGFEDLKQYQQQTQDWIFGYLSYDLKNDTENLKSDNFDGLAFPDLFFFQPKKLFLLKGDQLEMAYLHFCEDEMEDDIKDFLNPDFAINTQDTSIEIHQRISKANYLSKVNQMLEHIHRGDIYEANFCMEFYAENAQIEPFAIYRKLNTISKAPFACFLKNNNHFLLSASPERYLQKTGNQVLSQPIKGTAKRFENPEKDEQSKKELELNPKERSENIMIVDLVRNDLAHTADKGSVQVQELCGIYSFAQVHQMISTVVSNVSTQIAPVDILKSTFPMGSMTGAPKVSAMQIIENLEETKRGLYSGAVGYFTPTGDFDFNVVIRSILYNKSNQYLSFSVGSAITALANPDDEYQECLLKAKAMHEVLTN